MIKQSAPSVSIKPEHRETYSEIVREYESSRNGPGTYRPNFAQTEKRADIGVVTIRKPSKERSDQVIDERPALNPEPAKSNKLVFKYHEPTDQRPPHAPESVLYPGKWQFYDVDLDVVREQLASGNVYMAGGGETQE